jgi:hypothetical protein
MMDASASLMLNALGIFRDASVQPTPPVPFRAALVSGRQKRELRDAIIEAFPLDELSEVLYSRLDRNFAAIAPLNEPYSVQARRLIDVAANEGWLLELVSQLRLVKPGDASLAAVAEELGIAGIAPASQLERFVHAGSAFLDATSFRAGLEKIESAVGRIEIEDRLFAAGFLVAPDLLLTAGYAIEDLWRHKAPPSTVVLRFDYSMRTDGTIASVGTTYRLARNWLVDAEIASTDDLSKDDGLSYALLRVEGSPGVQPVGAGRAEYGARLRGWITMTSASPHSEEDKSILVVGHGLVFTGQLVGRRPFEIQKVIFYDAVTAPGSGGAPIFDSNLRLIGIHLGAQSKGRGFGFGMAIDAILASLELKGLANLVQAKLA